MTATKPAFHAVVLALLPARRTTFLWQLIAAAVAVAIALHWRVVIGTVTFEVVYVVAYAFIGSYHPMNPTSSQAVSTHLRSLSVPFRRIEWAHVVITLAVPIILAVGAFIAWPFAADTVWFSPLAMFVMTPALALIMSAGDLARLNVLSNSAIFQGLCVKVGLYLGWFFALFTLGSHWATFLPAVAMNGFAAWNLRYVIVQKTECYV